MKLISFSKETAFLILVLFGVLSSDIAWSQADPKAAFVEGAKKEGRLVWFTSTNLTESKPLLDDFAVDGCGGVSHFNHLCAPDRGDEAKGSSCGMGKHR